MRATEWVRDNEGYMNPLLLPICGLPAIAISTFPIWAAALYGAVPALSTRKDLWFGDYALDAFIKILGGVYVLGIPGALIGLVVSLF